MKFSSGSRGCGLLGRCCRRGGSRRARPSPPRFTVPVEYHKLAERPQGRPLARHDGAEGGRRRLLQHRLPHRAEGPHRLRAPLRAHDVPGLREPRQDGVHQARPVERRRPERLDALRLHELLRDRAVQRARDGALGRGRPHAGPRDHAGQPEEPAGRRQERGPGQRAEPAVRRVPVARPAAVREHQLVQRAQLLRRPEGPRRRDARGRQEVLQDLLRAEQRRARRHRRLRPEADAWRGSRSTSGRSRRDAAAAAGHLGAAAGEGEAGARRRTRSRPGPRSRSRTTPPSATRPSTTRWGSSTRSSCRARTAGSTRRSSRRTA